jgi:hypothetical protein
MKRLLMVTQLSNYDANGIFDLACDSGWQMCVNRVREMLKLDPDLVVDITGPKLDQVRTSPRFINPDLFASGRLHYVPMEIMPNALATRYDFDFEAVGHALALPSHKVNPQLRHDLIYVNDPMLLRHYRALFHVKAGYVPKFVVHSHFVDVPKNPKFPTEASLWLGQCEAAIKADLNFWQCQSAMNEFFDNMSEWFLPEIVEQVRAKSTPYDDGYSIEEITLPVNMENVRFTEEEFASRVGDKTIIFVPNRIGGKGRSSDYTNCGAFMFDILPELRKRREDFVVIAGNPNQKFLNHELEQMCGPNGYVSLVPDAFTRDEYRYIARRSHISIGLYTYDTYGGTSARELLELGTLPVWTDCNEYKFLASMANFAGGYPFLCRPDLSNLVDVLSEAIDLYRVDDGWAAREYVRRFQGVNRRLCSFEFSTPTAYGLMKRLVEEGAVTV